MRYSLDNAYGQVMGQFPFTGSGKVFIVGDSGTKNRSMLTEIFKVDPDGDVRFFSTIDAAVGACTANAGDVIYVMPGHTETIDAASALDVDVAGVQIIGLGQGSDRPVLDFTATAGTVDMAAANTRLSNLILRANVSAVVVGVNVDAAGVKIDHCRFEYNATGDDFITMIDIDGVDDVEVSDCELIAEDTAGCSEGIRLDDTDNTKILRNIIYGDFTDSAIVGEGAAGTNLVIADNIIYNSDTTAGNVIDLNVAFTGIIAGNRCGTLFATAPETAFDPGSCLCIENYVCNAVDESGTLVPVTVST